jgi:hypothetical protein
MPRRRKTATPRPVALLWPYNLTPAEFAAKYPAGLIQSAPLATALIPPAQREEDREEARQQA